MERVLLLLMITVKGISIEHVYRVRLERWVLCNNTHTHARTDRQTHTLTHAPVHARTHARTHARKHTHTRTHTRTHIHTHARTHARARTHTRTHARTRDGLGCEKDSVGKTPFNLREHALSEKCAIQKLEAI